MPSIPVVSANDSPLRWSRAFERDGAVLVSGVADRAACDAICANSRRISRSSIPTRASTKLTRPMAELRILSGPNQPDHRASRAFGNLPHLRDASADAGGVRRDPEAQLRALPGHATADSR